MQLPRQLLGRLAALVPLMASTLAPGAPAQAIAPEVASCEFLTASGAPSPIQHVIHIQFDNVHFTRDNPNVPSDLEQMPHLLNFIERNGTLLANNHTPLIAHTADDLVTALTGVYGNQHGIPVSNSFEYDNSSQVGAYNTSAFTYWTDRVAPDPADPGRQLPLQMLDAQGNNLPAPWVPFVSAGCNVGAVSTLNLELENNSTDINQVFGAGSPEANESSADRTNDFVGIAVHCADLTCSTVGSRVPKSDSQAKPELGGQGFAALYGHKYVASQVSPITETDGTPITGFSQANGFNPTPHYTLGYLASLLKANVPVVYGYISDAHDSRVNCAPTSPTNPVVGSTDEDQPCGAFAPGEPGYVAQLQAWDQGFQQFFDELDAMGIDQSNTLFVLHADENDHYTGSPPLNPGCDGVTVPCRYDRTKLGEITTDLPLLLKQQDLYDFGIMGGTGSTPGTPRPGFSNTDTPYAIDVDTAPGFWLKDSPSNGSAPQRTLEHVLSRVTAPNPYQGTTTSLLFSHLIDAPGLQALHMVTSDPNRTPGVVGFGQEDHLIQTSALTSPSNTSFCNTFPDASAATCLDNAFIWLHGDFASDIDQTWAAFVGPGVAQTGVDRWTWTDHADIRPTMMTLLCLEDTYPYEGRAVLEAIEPPALPPSVANRRQDLIELGREYKQLNAPVGVFGSAAIALSTLAVRGDDHTHTLLDGLLSSAVRDRDDVTAQMQAELGKVPGCGGLGDSRLQPLNASPSALSETPIAFGDLAALRARSVQLENELDADPARR